MANLVHFQTGVLRLPPVKFALADPSPAHHLSDGSADFRLFKTPIICSTLSRFSAYPASLDLVEDLHFNSFRNTETDPSHMRSYPRSPRKCSQLTIYVC